MLINLAENVSNNYVWTGGKPTFHEILVIYKEKATFDVYTREGTVAVNEIWPRSTAITIL